jgi:hypothetical protein
MNKYANYLKEREGLDYFEDDTGFITYCFYPEIQAVYLAEVYVIPEKRGTFAALRLFQKAVKIAKYNGYTKLLGSVDKSTNGYELSEKIMIKLNWEFFKQVGEVTYYIGKI